MAGTASPPAAGAPWKRNSRIPQVLLALALGAGFLDAATYLGFGHVFPANMTGNTVLLAVAAIRGNIVHALRSVTALAGFGAGVGLGAAIVHPRGRWPRRAAGVFWLECLLLAALLLLWVVLGAAAARYWLIALASAAMGGQSVAVRASHVSGVQTTYMTSTYQSAIARLIFRLRGIREENAGPALPGSAWVTYGLGALAGALAETGWGVASVAVPLAIVLGVSVSAVRVRPERPAGGPGTAGSRAGTGR